MGVQQANTAETLRMGTTAIVSYYCTKFAVVVAVEVVSPQQ